MESLGPISVFQKVNMKVIVRIRVILGLGQGGGIRVMRAGT